MSKMSKMCRMCRTSKAHKTRNRKKLKMFSTFACLLVLPLLLSGCMPYKELKDQSIVEGMGIDYGPGGYNITFQIYKPQKGGGGGSSKKSDSSTVTILQSSGASLFDAVRNATLQNGRKLYFSDTRAYVVSEEVCKKDFAKLLDFMERNQQIRPNERLIIAKGKASDIMTFKKEDEILPAQNLQLMMEDYVQTSKIPNIQLFDIYKDTADGIIDPLSAAVQIEKGPGGKPIMQMEGTAIFHNNRLCGYLDKAGTRGYLWIKGSAQGGVVTVRLANGATATMEVLGCSSKTEVSGDENAPTIKVDIKLASNLTEVQSQAQYNVDSVFISNLEKLQNKVVSDEAYDAVNIALKSYNADIFGFGLNFYENKPELWRKLSKNWETDVSKVKVEITVNSSIRHTGLTAQTVFAGNNNTAKSIK